MFTRNVFNLHEWVVLYCTTAYGAFGTKIFRHLVCRPKGLVVHSGILALHGPII